MFNRNKNATKRDSPKNQSSYYCYQYFPLIMLITATVLLLAAYYLGHIIAKDSTDTKSTLTESREAKQSDSSNYVHSDEFELHQSQEDKAQ